MSVESSEHARLAALVHVLACHAAMSSLAVAGDRKTPETATLADPPRRPTLDAYQDCRWTLAADAFVELSGADFAIQRRLTVH